MREADRFVGAGLDEAGGCSLITPIQRIQDLAKGRHVLARNEEGPPHPSVEGPVRYADDHRPAFSMMHAFQAEPQRGARPNAGMFAALIGHRSE